MRHKIWFSKIFIAPNFSPCFISMRPWPPFFIAAQGGCISSWDPAGVDGDRRGEFRSHRLDGRWLECLNLHRFSFHNSQSWNLRLRSSLKAGQPRGHPCQGAKWRDLTCFPSYPQSSGCSLKELPSLPRVNLRNWRKFSMFYSFIFWSCSSL